MLSPSFVIWHGLGRDLSLELVPVGARLQWDMLCIFQLGSLPAALAGEREEEKAQVRSERLFSVCW